MPGFLSYLFGKSSSTKPTANGLPVSRRDSSFDSSWASPNLGGPTPQTPDMASGQGHQRSNSGSTFPSGLSSDLYAAQHPPPSPSLTPNPNSQEFTLRPTHAGASYSVYPASSQAASYPPIKQTFTRLRDLLAPIYPELLDTLSYPLPEKQLVSFQKTLHDSQGNPVRVPRDVKEYLACHDGQDIFSISSSALNGGSGSSMGLVYGLWLMTADEILEEWAAWRRLESRKRLGQPVVDDPFNFISREEEELYLRAKMGSCPAGWIREEYSCPGWIPLIKDGMGNYIGIDLDPPQVPNLPASSSRSNSWELAAARPGQIIAFGREIDVKTVIFPGWGPDGGFARFLSALVDDLEAGEFATLGDLVTSSPLIASSSLKSSKSGESGDWTDQVAYASPVIASAASADAQPDYYSTEDGLGDLGYFEQDMDTSDATFSRAGRNANRLSGGRRITRGARWRLKGKYSGMGVIEALCMRSQSRWAEVDLYSSKAPKSRKSASQHARQRSEGDGKTKVLFRIPSPAPLMQAEEESPIDPPEVVLPPLSPHAEEPGTPLSVTLSPPSPNKGGQMDNTIERSSISEQLDRTSLSSSTASTRSKGKMRASTNRRPPPPPPAALDLPTLLDMSEGGSSAPIEVVVK